MIKSFLITISLSILLYSSQQLVLVVANDFNTSKAKLECYEDGILRCDEIDVNIGKNGLGWGVGDVSLTHKASEPTKKEGDKKAPIGVFKLTNIFGYAPNSHYKLPYLHTSQNLICVDDSNSNFYNQIIEKNGDEKSFEYMKRDDGQYELGIVVAHNQDAKSQAGSCIFLHVQKSENAGTAGCTSMRLEDLERVANWLDKSKNPILIQIPKKLSGEVIKLYPELKNSKLF